MGGMLAAIEHGWVQEQIHRSAYEWLRQVESGERVVVGVNRFVEDASPSPPPTFRPDAKVERERARALAEWRRDRNAAAVTKARGRLERAARGEDNLMPPILEAIVARATLGEICDTLRQVFGSYRPSAR
jgi:methylmalonyl-CoA mutase N-terminal domain/subunit